jgi:hypothetical protein
MTLIQISTFIDTRATLDHTKKNYYYQVALTEILEDNNEIYSNQVELITALDDQSKNEFHARIEILFNWLLANYANQSISKIHICTNDFFIKSLIKQINLVQKYIHSSSVLKKKQKELAPVDFARHVLLNYGIIKKDCIYLENYLEKQVDFIQLVRGSKFKELVPVNLPANKQIYKKGEYTEVEQILYKNHNELTNTTLRFVDSTLGLSNAEITAELKIKFIEKKLRRGKKKR